VRGLLTFTLGIFGLVLIVAAGIAIYYAISYLVLYLVGRVFPLTGRRRR